MVSDELVLLSISMASPPRVIGTLVVIVLKAVGRCTCAGLSSSHLSWWQNHLPNKRHIGKQDPYCVVNVNEEKKRTKAIKKGGQHPEWDEELRFEMQEAPEPESTDGTPPAPPPKNGKPERNLSVAGGKTMKIACYADDPREPDFIGEASVDLTEVLTKGECDGQSGVGTILFPVLMLYFRMVHFDEQGQVFGQSVSRNDLLVKCSSQ